MDFYLLFGFLVYFFGLILLQLRLNPFIFVCVVANISFQFWIYFNYGNIDLFLFGIITSLSLNHIGSENQENKWYNNENLIAFILGICTFKGTVCYVFIFFLLNAKNKKIFTLYFLTAVFLNYFWFLFDIPQLLRFLNHITLQDHPDTNIYLLGIHYPWIWGTIGIFIQNLSLINKKRSDKPKPIAI
jgi:hypothetical protein